MTTTSLPTTKLARLTGHNGAINALTYSSGTGQYLLSGSSDRSINLYNPSKAPPLITTTSSSITSSNLRSPSTPHPSKPSPSPALIQTYTGAHSHEILSLAVSPDNSTFLSSGGDKYICTWDVATARTLRRLGGSGPGSHNGRVQCVSFAGSDSDMSGSVAQSPSVVVSGSYDATVRLWDLRAQGNRPMMVFSEARDAISTVYVSGSEIWAGSVDGRIRGYDIRLGTLCTDVIGQSITSLTPTQDGGFHFVSTLDSTLRLIDKHSGRQVKAYTSPDYQNTAYRIRSTLACAGTVVLAGSEDGGICAWDVVTEKLIYKVWHSDDGGGELDSKVVGKRARKIVSAVVWRQKGARGDGELASAGADGTIVIWGRRDSP